MYNQCIIQQLLYTFQSTWLDLHIISCTNSSCLISAKTVTHEASKLVTPLRDTSLLPCPADQSSLTLKSVHRYCKDPKFRPSQPLRQTRDPPPISAPEATVLAVQLCPSSEVRLQAMRWVNRTYANRLDTCTQVMKHHRKIILINSILIFAQYS